MRPRPNTGIDYIKDIDGGGRAPSGGFIFYAMCALYLRILEYAELGVRANDFPSKSGRGLGRGPIEG